jgi:hypothetical protein
MTLAAFLSRLISILVLVAVLVAVFLKIYPGYQLNKSLFAAASAGTYAFWSLLALAGVLGVAAIFFHILN